MDLLVVNIAELATPQGQGRVEGTRMGDLTVLREAFVLCREGQVEALGPMNCLPNWNGPILDAKGATCTPGLVDPHTHTVFAGSRVDEFLARAQGESYTGGGIVTSAHALAETSVEELVKAARPRLQAMLRRGVTTIEAKSGYGLTLDNELKLLQAVGILAREAKAELIPTFLGAHAVPPGWERSAYVEHVISDMLPRVAGSGLATFCDVFCDQGFFTVEESERILRAAQGQGLKIKLHADELADTGGAELAARLGATSADHLLRASRAGLQAMKEAGVVGVLLPGTAFVLNEPYAPARTMIDGGLAVALGTDFNPGSCPVISLPLCLSLAVLRMGMTVEESLCAATLNASAAVGAADRLGSLEPGKIADLVLWDVPTYRELPYWIGHDLVGAVVKGGELVWRRSESAPTPS
ncbi:MAG: imidazolonepropionase [Candidatus Bipolaricaulota bacterium]